MSNIGHNNPPAAEFEDILLEIENMKMGGIEEVQQAVMELKDGLTLTEAELRDEEHLILREEDVHGLKQLEVDASQLLKNINNGRIGIDKRLQSFNDHNRGEIKEITQHFEKLKGQLRDLLKVSQRRAEKVERERRQEQLRVAEEERRKAEEQDRILREKQLEAQRNADEKEAAKIAEERRAAEELAVEATANLGVAAAAASEEDVVKKDVSSFLKVKNDGHIVLSTGDDLRKFMYENPHLFTLNQAMVATMAREELTKLKKAGGKLVGEVVEIDLIPGLKINIIEQDKMR